MSDVLCIYYSRTGNTQRVMEDIRPRPGRSGAERLAGLSPLRAGRHAEGYRPPPAL